MLIATSDSRLALLAFLLLPAAGALASFIKGSQAARRAIGHNRSRKEH